MAHGRFWRDDELDALRRVYADPLIRDPAAAHVLAYPDRKIDAVRLYAGKLHIANALPPAKPPRALKPVAVKLPTPGPCDHGDREHIRRRICTSLLPQMALELNRTEIAIADALKILAEADFCEEPMYGYTARDLAQTATPTKKSGRRP
jgi:hypothetical protein